MYFILSEEDKTTDASLDYWFRCCDLDGDGRLSPDELLYFYEEQLHRMECLSQVGSGGCPAGCARLCHLGAAALMLRGSLHRHLQESVSFEDIMAQMQDMINPLVRGWQAARAASWWAL